METAFSEYHSGAAPAMGKSLMSGSQGVGQGRGQHQDADVVHAAAHVQHRRDAQRPADLP
jgi:hypothetical protein